MGTGSKRIRTLAPRHAQTIGVLRSFGQQTMHPGAISARGPNLQQVPKSKQKGFRAPPGQLGLALDYSQIELRAVAEIISYWADKDSILPQSFAAGLDAHTATAMAMTGKDRAEDITPKERQMAKPCNFGLLYRMGDRSFCNYIRAGYRPNITYAAACDLRARAPQERYTADQLNHGIFRCGGHRARLVSRGCWNIP